MFLMWLCKIIFLAILFISTLYLLAYFPVFIYFGLGPVPKYHSNAYLHIYCINFCYFLYLLQMFKLKQLLT